jgi:dTDP-glucose 4,6-dehydratase/UDP-glucuronate decarboxylase
LLSREETLNYRGAGFLGYYLVQSILYWNKITDEANNVQLTIYDNYIRGIPDWLLELRTNKDLTLVKHDITNPLPKDIDDFHYIIHAASIASPTYYRKYPIETMDANVNGLRFLLEYCRGQKKNKPVEGFCFTLPVKFMGTLLLKIFPLLKHIVAMFLLQVHALVMMNRNVMVKPFV